MRRHRRRACKPSISGLAHDEVMNSFSKTSSENPTKTGSGYETLADKPMLSLFRQLRSQGLITLPTWNDELCEYHGKFGHSTENCAELKNAILKLIEQGKIEKPSFQIMKIDGDHENEKTEKDVVDSFSNIKSHRQMDLLGQPSGKFDFQVFYTPSPTTPLEEIVPTGWGPEFDDIDRIVDVLDEKLKVEDHNVKVVRPINVWYDSKEDDTVSKNRK